MNMNANTPTQDDPPDAHVTIGDVCWHAWTDGHSLRAAQGAPVSDDGFLLLPDTRDRLLPLFDVTTGETTTVDALLAWGKSRVCSRCSGRGRLTCYECGGSGQSECGCRHCRGDCECKACDRGTTRCHECLVPNLGSFDDVLFNVNKLCWLLHELVVRQQVDRALPVHVRTGWPRDPIVIHGRHASGERWLALLMPCMSDGGAAVSFDAWDKPSP